MRPASRHFRKCSWTVRGDVSSQHSSKVAWGPGVSLRKSATLEQSIFHRKFQPMVAEALDVDGVTGLAGAARSPFALHSVSRFLQQSKYCFWCLKAASVNIPASEGR